MTFTDRVATLGEAELEALARASTWYANYFAHELAAEAQHTHAQAVAERESFLALVAALRKLGVRVTIPDELLADIPSTV
jgi:hypothetical protein